MKIQSQVKTENLVFISYGIFLHRVTEIDTVFS